MTSPQQTAFLLLPEEEALYGGAAGGGKSDALLADAVKDVDVPGYAALFLRRSFTDLSLPGAALARSKQWWTDKADWNERLKTWTFPSESTITFGYVERESDVYRYQSAEFQAIYFDELTQFSRAQYLYMFSRLRRSVAVKVKPRMRAASNPGNVGHAWVKRDFVDHGGRNERILEDGSRSVSIFIPAKVADNPGLVVGEYRRSLLHLPEILVQQLLEGDWGAFEGMAFARFGDLNIIPSFELDDAFSREEACDYGLNGTAWALVVTDYDGNLVFFDTIEAKDLLPDQVCELVHDKRKRDGGNWGAGNVVWADPSLFHRTYGRTKFGDPSTLDQEFADNGVALSRGNNDPRAGVVRLRTLIEPDETHPFPAWHDRAGELGSPRLFCVGPTCRPLTEALAAAPLQPIDKVDAGEKIDPVWESAHGHFTAMARYAVMSRPAASVRPPEREPDDPRAALLWRHRRASERKQPFNRARYLT